MQGRNQKFSSSKNSLGREFLEGLIFLELLRN